MFNEKGLRMGLQQRAIETRTRILQAAEERFALEGYDATGVAEICQEAEVSKGAFYHHFGSKQEVFLELLANWLSEMDKQLALLGKATGNVPDRILSMTRVVRAVLQAAQRGLPIYLEFWSRALRDPEVMETMIEPFRKYRMFFTEILEEGTQEGTLALNDPPIAAQVVLSLALGLLVQGIFDPEGADWERVSMEGIGVILKGYEKR
jgi:AcrR family transcriptional regulator